MLDLDSLTGFLVCGSAIMFFVALAALVVALVAVNRAGKLQARYDEFLSRMNNRVNDLTLEVRRLRQTPGITPTAAAPDESATVAPPTAAPQVSAVPAPVADLDAISAAMRRRAELRGTFAGPVSPSSASAAPSSAARTAAQPTPPAWFKEDQTAGGAAQAAAAGETAGGAATAPPPLPPHVTPAPQPSEPSGSPKPRGRGLVLEERLGVKLFVGIAAVALAAAGIYFVKLSYAWLKPEYRIVIGMAFGAILLGGGEFLRRRSARIASALAASGIAVLFAVVLAGIHLERYLHGQSVISPALGFVLLSVTAALAVVLSLRHGPMVAVLGLVGGFATPALVHSNEHSPGVLFGYLFLLQVGLIAVTYRRKWWWMTVLTMFGGYAWALLWLIFYVGPTTPNDATWLGLYLLGNTAAFVLVALAPGADDQHPSTRIGPIRLLTLIRWGGAVIGLLLLAGLVRTASYTTRDWAFFGILGAGCMALARVDRRQRGLGALASGMTAALLLIWTFAGVAADQQQRFGWITLALGVLYALGAYICLWRSSRAGMWATLSACAAVAYLLVAYRGINDAVLPWPRFWGSVCVALALVYIGLAVPIYRRRAGSSDMNFALAALAAGVCALLALAVPIELSRAWIAVAWALLAPALVVIDLKLRVPVLRTIAGILVAMVAVRLLLNPAVLTYPIGPTPIFNWLLYGYGVPMLAFAATAWLLRRPRPDASLLFSAEAFSEAVEIVAIALGVALVTLEVRHFFHRSAAELGFGEFRFFEWGAYSSAGVLMAIGLLAWSIWRQSMTLRTTAYILLLAVLAVMVFGPGLMANPLWNTESVHALGTTRLWNSLLYVYGLPALLLAAGAWWCARRGEADVARAVGLAALVWFVLLTGLQVRHSFHAYDDMTVRVDSTSLIESATYAVAFLTIALGLLLSAGRWAEPVLLHAGAALLALGALVEILGPSLNLNPLWVATPIPGLPVLNSLLYIYGLPALLLAVAWILSHKNKWPQLQLSGVAALVVLLLLVTLQIRHGFHRTDMTVDFRPAPTGAAPEASLTELATYAVAFLALAVSLLAAERRFPARRLAEAAAVLLVVTIPLTLVVLGLLANPLWHDYPVRGRVVLNMLLYIYAVPAALCALAGRLIRGLRGIGDIGGGDGIPGSGVRGIRGADPQIKTLCVLPYSAALALVFALLNTEVAQAFHGSILSTGPTIPAETYFYSFAWLVMGVSLLLLGIFFTNGALRWASLALMMASVGKVALWDVRNLQDFYRVLSLVGLALALLFIAYLYQAFVFGRAATTHPGATQPDK